MNPIVNAIVFVLAAPAIGGLLAGIDRKISARMQGRIGPPVLQPFYDVGKLFEKERTMVNDTQGFYILCYFIFLIFTGALFFAGGDLLLVVFSLTLAHIFLILGAYSVYSPYSHIGAERELLLVMAYEPMTILLAVGMFMVTKSFFVRDILASNIPVIVMLPGIFLGFLYILTIKLRKSPFDISTSHHAHQELVKGLTTEFSGPTLGLIEVAHWYEAVLLLGMLFLFFAFSPLLGLIAVFILYVFEIFIDNTNARVKWRLTLESAWIVTILVGVVNLVALYFMKGV